MCASSCQDDLHGWKRRRGLPPIEEASVAVVPEEVERHRAKRVPDVVDYLRAGHPLVTDV
ncbi:hypothetical protein DD238_008463 [Peronospora effusa]|uniref:Uncharacterized protein n=1 Tax=Peronospora effusa TaxID=542832 RepID=A0A3M6VE05_9STRA|nr:hypothetical protein DD238_008463 [Peronospora effusa]RQM11101.1 hypothetical protein DD237_008400 [Peronospora effusa]